MAVQVLEPMSIHKPVVLRFIVGRSTGCNGLANHLINGFSILARQTHEHFRAFRRVTDVFGSERLELCFGEQHDVDIVTNNHASCRLVRKLGIKAEAERLKEVHGPAEFFDGQIYEYFSGHVGCAVGAGLWD